MQYRIAYLTALAKAGGNLHCKVESRSLFGCEAVSGLALLYNPGRVRNLMLQTPANELANAQQHNAPYDEEEHLQWSLPACDVASGSNVVSFIDGPMHREKCNHDTPGGLAWVASDVMAMARLEWIDRSGAFFHAYNVHLPLVGADGVAHAEAVRVVNDAVTALEERFGTPRWIPPILMGDLNNLDNEEATHRLRLLRRPPANLTRRSSPCRITSP